MVGHIKLDRKIIQWEWYQDANVCRLFIHLLLIANHKDGSWQGKPIKRGQLVTGLDKLSTSTGLSIQQIRTCFDKLKSTKEITYSSTNKNRLVTICKYDTYQSFRNDNNKLDNNEITDQATSHQQTDNKRITANNNDNKNNNENNIISLGEKKFNQKPVETDFNGLPENYYGKAIELVRITKQTDIDIGTVKSMWEIFKVQKLTGSEFYSNEGKVYSHFIDWIKFQNFNKNGNTSEKKHGTDFKSMGADLSTDRIKSKLAQVKRF